MVAAVEIGKDGGGLCFAFFGDGGSEAAALDDEEVLGSVKGFHGACPCAGMGTEHCDQDNGVNLKMDFIR